jgi:pilus assembly protein CpaF
MNYLLEVRKNQVPVRALSFDRSSYIFGRASDADVLLDDATIGPRHLRIEKRHEEILIFSLDTRFPVLVNGKRVQSTLLRTGDVVEIGEYQLAIVTDETPSDDRYQLIKDQIHEELVSRLNVERIDLNKINDEALRERCRAEIEDIITNHYLPPKLDVARLKREILNDALGLGPLEPLLQDETVTEVMVNSQDTVFVERGGKLSKEQVRFANEQQILNIISRIVAPIGRRIDESSPMVDARLKDGSRVNAIIRPLSIRGPMLTIRKFSKRKLVAADAVKLGSLSVEMVSFLKFAVETRQNIVISGGTGSGKTTLLNILSNFIPADERVITIEDSAELQLNHENLGSLEARQANVEGRGAVAIRDLVKNALRMRPDRIVVGECRAGEALDMLQAMNTGHDGSLTTLHANSPEDAILRLESLVLMAGFELPITAIRRQISSAVDLVIQQSRLRDGSRRIMRICEIDGMQDGEVILRDIFVFRQQGFDSEDKVIGTFSASGYVPIFVRQYNEIGRPFNEEVFQSANSPKEGKAK